MIFRTLTIILSIGVLLNAEYLLVKIEDEKETSIENRGKMSFRSGINGQSAKEFIYKGKNFEGERL